MNPERFSSRRDILKNAGALGISLAVGIPLVACGENDKNTLTDIDIPPYISSKDVEGTNQGEADGITSLGKDTEVKTEEFTSFHFPYSLKQKPKDWAYQPGLSINQNPIDIFLGDYYGNTQTMVWNYMTPVAEGVTPIEYMNTILEQVTFEQKQRNDALNLPSGGYLMDLPAGQIQKVAGHDQGWLIYASMPGYDTESHFDFVNIGFIHENKVWQGNMKFSNHPQDLGEYYKFETMADSVKIKT